MADFEDAHSPTWQGTIEGQMNLRDAIRGAIGYDSPEGKKYSLNDQTAVLMVRPRGWHLCERHVTVDGQPVSGGIFDFALYLVHNARALTVKGTGPYFYLPKLENHLEARLWNDVLTRAEQAVGLPVGTVKVTVLIETILAASRWTRFSTSCATTSSGSTADAGITSSASSRSSATGPISSCPTGRL